MKSDITYPLNWVGSTGLPCRVVVDTADDLLTYQ